MKFAAIKEHHLYNKAFAKGARATGETVTVCILKDYAAKRLMLANPQKHYVNRIGLSVTKRVGGACVRTRSKRIIREALRSVERDTPLKVGYLIVISARPAIVGKKTQDVERDLRAIFRQLQFTRTNPEPVQE